MRVCGGGGGGGDSAARDCGRDVRRAAASERITVVKARLSPLHELCRRERARGGGGGGGGGSGGGGGGGSGGGGDGGVGPTAKVSSGGGGDGGRRWETQLKIVSVARDTKSASYQKRL